jgi:hypothetical protein
VSRVRRGHAADHRVRPHAEIEDPAVPGTCQICRLPTGTANQLHTDRPPAAVQAHNAVERARLADND